MKRIGSFFALAVLFWFLNIDVLLINTEDSTRFELSISMGMEAKRDE